MGAGICGAAEAFGKHMIKSFERTLSNDSPLTMAGHKFPNWGILLINQLRIYFPRPSSQTLRPSFPLIVILEKQTAIRKDDASKLFALQNLCQV